MGKKVKLPKRLWGVKIPKAVRKGAIGRFLGSSGGQVVLAEVFLAASAYYAARRIDPDTPIGETLRHPIDGLRAGRDWSRGTSDRFARAVRAGVQSFRASLQESQTGVLASDAQTLETGPENATEVSLEADSPAKKPASSRRESRREATTGPH